MLAYVPKKKKKCLYLVDLNNPRILMTHDKMAVAANIGA